MTKTVVISFIIKGKGDIAGATVLSSSGNAGIDLLLLEVINKMPGWQPSHNQQGIKVSQQFKRTVSNGSEGCRDDRRTSDRRSAVCDVEEM